MAIHILAGILPVFCCLLLLIAAPPRTGALHNNEHGYGDTAAGEPELAQEEIDELVARHNEGRAEVEPTAANMNKVVSRAIIFII